MNKKTITRVLLLATLAIALMFSVFISLVGVNPAWRFFEYLVEKKPIVTQVEFGNMEIQTPQPWEADKLDRMVYINDTDYGILITISKGNFNRITCVLNSIETKDKRYEPITLNIDGKTVPGVRLLEKTQGIKGAYIDLVIEPDILIHVYVDDGTLDNRAGIKIAEEYLSKNVKLKDY
jgi:hypothetical protein